MITSNDPVAARLVNSLSRPGGMITGIAGFGVDLTGKHIELLLAAAPKVKRVGFLVPARGVAAPDLIEAARRSAQHYAVEARFAEVARAEEIEPAIARLAREGVQGLVMLPIALLNTERLRIANFALARQCPVVGANDYRAEAGAVLSYGATQAIRYSRAAWYVDRILRGAKPGDLPIEHPMTFDLVVNAKAAKVLGLTMPPEIMVRATRVIQ